MILVFLQLSFKPVFFTLLFHPYPMVLQSLFTFCHQSGIICVSELVEISPSNLHSAFESSSPAFCMMYSAYKLNKQHDDTRPCRSPFPIMKQSFVPTLVLTGASWPPYRFLRRQVEQSGTALCLRIFSICCDPRVRGLSVVNDTEVDVLEKVDVLDVYEVKRTDLSKNLQLR